ncbi:MAG TPA: V-type ATP synthase subunit B [Candidatus Acidoferrales bacterium]|nr:V-type ATP synthase subunit B [Candidatus Acidoferrales bacterium]
MKGTVLAGLEHRGVHGVRGPLLFLSGVRNVGFGELAEVRSPSGQLLHGRVLDIDGDAVVVEVFEGTAELSLQATTVRFLGHPLRVPVGREMLGRVFDAFGSPLDGAPRPIADDTRDVNGGAINPVSRAYPSDCIQTGISCIDGMNTLVRGQKLPIFSGSGLPHDQLAAQIVRQATIVGEKEGFGVVFAAIGVTHDVAEFFQRSFQESGASHNSVLFLNLADAPSVARLVAPRTALTMAEYLAFDLGLHVLVVLTDVTNYCEALREVATARGEVPSRKGYPGYLYSDLAALFERAGRIHGRPGSITQLPILTMPNDDITHPIPDVTGYITEGQLVLSRELHNRGVYPPVDVLPSLSRLMEDGIGEQRTRADHSKLASQLYAAYAKVKEIERLASIIGSEELSEPNRRYLQFGARFEREFLSQAAIDSRSFEDTLDLGWKVLEPLPDSELTRVTQEQIERYRRSREATLPANGKATEGAEDAAA